MDCRINSLRNSFEVYDDAFKFLLNSNTFTDEELILGLQQI